MKSDYSKEFIIILLRNQLAYFLVEAEEMRRIENELETVLDRVEFCFKFSENKYYKNDGDVFFNPFHSGQWCIFLYFLGNTLYRQNPNERHLCDKIYYLNKMLNSCDLFYEVELPDIFMLDHPLGSIMGRAKYANFFAFAQGCTVGNNKGMYPLFGERVTMSSNSKVLGNSIIGNNVIIAANAYIKDEIIESNQIVFGSSPNLILKQNS